MKSKSSQLIPGPQYSFSLLKLSTKFDVSHVCILKMQPISHVRPLA